LGRGPDLAASDVNFRKEISMTKNTDILHDICDQLGGWEDGQAEPSIDIGGVATPINAALGQLWHDTDLLPASLRSRVTDFVDRRPETITTYAAAAQALMPVVKEGLST
jgi:hypothetical protein